MSDKNVEQMRLVFGGDGPFTLAIAAEDTDSSHPLTESITTTGGVAKHQNVTGQGIGTTAVDRGGWPAIAGYLMYSPSKSLMLQIVGVVQDDQSHFGVD